MRIEIVKSKDHRLGELLTKGDYSNPRGYCKARYAVIATDSGKVVGFWKFTRQGKAIRSKCTWIHRDYRRQRLAKRLWAVGIGVFDPPSIKVTVTSDRGFTLVKSLRETFPKIKFRVLDVGERKLRDLRK